MTDLEKNSHFMDKYSRQLGAYGVEAMSKLIKLKVLVVSAGGQALGVEICKNLVLAGPAAVTVHDDTPTTIADLGGNFFLRKEDVGTARSEAIVPRLRDLNPDVEVKSSRGFAKSAAEKTLRGDSRASDAEKEAAEKVLAACASADPFVLTEELVAAHDLVLFSGGSRDELVKWNAFCRSRTATLVDTKGHETVVPQPIKFIATGTKGAAGFMFTDFGPGFRCHDHDGEPPVVRHIRHISNAKEGVVTLLTEEEGGSSHHNLPESIHNGYVTFTEVAGMCAADDKALAEIGLNINASGPWKVKHNTRKVMRKQRDGSYKEETVFDPYSFRIGDTTALTPYIGRGFVTQHKRPTIIEARSMGSTLQQPIPAELDSFSFNAIDGTKFFGGVQLHLALLAVWEYEAKHGSLPPVGDADAAAEVVKLAHAINDSLKMVQSMSGDDVAFAVDDVDEAVITKYALHAGAELQPMAAFFGGVAAQEVVKACAKFKPIDQWFHFDAFEVLPAERPADAVVGADSRYAHQISVFGQALQDKMGASKTFMVGCGALGCEYLKNFALMGIACGAGGEIATTDNDRIEVSNLNRQFLFRAHNVGQPKSSAAAVAVKEMNPDIKVKAMEELVHPGSEHIFNDTFWASQDWVTNALDNVKARNYVDGRCVFFEKPLLESGTMGTKANVQVVLPHKTISYSDGPRESEQNIPMCTIRNFPSQIEHCIEWARAEFHSLFVHPFQQAMKVTKDPAEFVASLRGEIEATKSRGERASLVEKKLKELQDIRTVLDLAQSGVTFDKCLALAYSRFHYYYRDMIESLTDKFPKDHKTRGGDDFWSGTKRFPTAATYTPSDGNHALFVKATANILAAAYGVVPPPETELLPADHEFRNDGAIAGKLAGMPVPERTRVSVDMEGEDNDEEDGEGEGEDGKEAGAEESKTAGGADDLEAELAATEAKLEEQLKFVSSLSSAALALEPADFEKDQDANFHIDFITAASNLRAANYEITQASRHKCKMIAGKIIPAIATTTAAITGLVGLEMYKLVQDKPLGAFRDCNINLAVNSFQFFEPTEVAVNKGGMDPSTAMPVVPYKPEGFTKWDKIIVKEGRDLTLQELLDVVKERHGAAINFLESELASAMGVGKPVYGGYGKTDAKMTDLVTKKFGDAVPIVGDDRSHMRLIASAENEKGEDLAMPPVIYYWK